MTDTGAADYRRFLQGDNTALEDLVRAYSDELVRYAYCYVKNAAAAEDIMEDTFAALFVKRKSFGENGSFKAYLFRIARNKCFDRKRRERFVQDRNAEAVLKSGDAEREIAVRERNRTLYLGLQSLPAQYGGVLHLVYLDGFSVEETARILGKTRKQTYNLLARAKTSLRTFLEKEGIGYEDV